MNRLDFIEYINDRLSGDCSVPIKLPEKTIDRIITDSMLWMVEHYDESTEKIHSILDQSMFATDTYKNERYVQMPDCIIAVTALKELNKLGRFPGLGVMDADYHRHHSTLMSGGYYRGTVGSDGGLGSGVIYRLASEAYNSFLKGLTLDTVAFTYNDNSHKLRIQGRDPKGALYAELYIMTDVENMFGNIFFRDYVYYKCLEKFTEIHSFIDYNLPGGVKLNISNLSQIATRGIEKTEKSIADRQTTDFFLLEE